MVVNLTVEDSGGNLESSGTVIYMSAGFFNNSGLWLYLSQKDMG